MANKLEIGFDHIRAAESINRDRGFVVPGYSPFALVDGQPYAIHPRSSERGFMVGDSRSEAAEYSLVTENMRRQGIETELISGIAIDRVLYWQSNHRVIRQFLHRGMFWVPQEPTYGFLTVGLGEDREASLAEFEQRRNVKGELLYV